jgi:hypothetical protein
MEHISAEKALNSPKLRRKEQSAKVIKVDGIVGSNL